jgi:hypothetical protein
MSRILDKASLTAVAFTLIATLFSADGSGANAQVSRRAVEQEPARMISQPVVQPLPAVGQAAPPPRSPHWSMPSRSTSSRASLPAWPGRSISNRRASRSKASSPSAA